MEFYVRFKKRHNSGIPFIECSILNSFEIVLGNFNSIATFAVIYNIIMRDNNSNRGGNTGGRGRRLVSAGRGSDERSFRRDSDERPYYNRGNNNDRDDRPYGGNSSNGKRPRNGAGSGIKSRGKRPRIGGSQDQKRVGFGNRGTKPSISRKKSYSGADYENRAVKRANEKLSGSRINGQNFLVDDNKEVRLNRFVANSGICSRREADNYITAGLISVNGKIITELGTKVQPGDDVRFNGERLRGEEKVYIVMNKPKDFVTTTSDPHADRTVMDLVSGRCSGRVYPVGRLDKATTGVLLLTNDGDLADKLMHPSFEKKKIYQVTLDKNLKGSDFKQILEGIELEDGFICADDLAYIDGDKTQLGIEIHSGKNRIIRRIFEHFGYRIKKLDRVYFAGLTKKNLRRGQWRFLSDQEVAMLKMGSYE